MQPSTQQQSSSALSQSAQWLAINCNMFEKPGFWNRPHPPTHMGSTTATAVSPPGDHRHHHHQLSISFLLNPVEPAGAECAFSRCPGPAAHPKGGDSRPAPLQATTVDRSCSRGKVSIHSLLHPPEMAATTSGGGRTSPSGLPSPPRLLAYLPSVWSPQPSQKASSTGTSSAAVAASIAADACAPPSKNGTRRNHHQHQQAHQAAAMTLFEPFLEMQRREEHLIQQREKYLIFETQRLELRKQLTQLQLRLGYSVETQAEQTTLQHQHQQHQRQHKRRLAAEDGQRAEPAVSIASKRRRRDTTKADDGEKRHRRR